MLHGQVDVDALGAARDLDAVAERRDRAVRPARAAILHTDARATDQPEVSLSQYTLVRRSRSTVLHAVVGGDGEQQRAPLTLPWASTGALALPLPLWRTGAGTQG